MKIYFIRHAHFCAHGSKGNRYNTSDNEQHLSPLGWDQALELDYLLAKSGIFIDRIYSSTMARAIETILPYSIRMSVSITMDHNLREVKLDKADSYWTWRDGSKTNYDFTGINSRSESRSQAYARYVSAVDKAVAENTTDSNIIVCSHGIAMENFFLLNNLDVSNVKLEHPTVYSCDYKNQRLLNLKRETSLIPENATLNTPTISLTNFYPQVNIASSK